MTGARSVILGAGSPRAVSAVAPWSKESWNSRPESEAGGAAEAPSAMHAANARPRPTPPQTCIASIRFFAMVTGVSRSQKRPIYLFRNKQIPALQNFHVKGLPAEGGAYAE